jgi:hypothetical protein
MAVTDGWPAVTVGLVVVATLTGCATHRLPAADRCVVADALTRGMTQDQVRHLAGFGIPTVFGRARVSSRPGRAGIYRASLAVGHSLPLDAPDIAWLYVATGGAWTLIDFEGHRVTAIRCVEVVQPGAVK